MVGPLSPRVFVVRPEFFFTHSFHIITAIPRDTNFGMLTI